MLRALRRALLPCFTDASSTKEGTSPLFGLFAGNPHKFCQGFTNPINPVHWEWTLKHDFKKIQKLHMKEGLGYDKDGLEKLQTRMAKILQHRTDAGKFCNTSSRVLATLTQNSSSYNLRKKEYFRKWHNCLFKQLGKDLAFFKFSTSACRKRRRRIPQFPCKRIRKKFKKAMKCLRVNREDVSIPDLGCRNQFLSSPQRRPLPQEDEHGAGVEDEEEDEEGRRNRADEDTDDEKTRSNAMHSQRFDNFFENPSEFCRWFENALGFGSNYPFSVVRLRDDDSPVKDVDRSFISSVAATTCQDDTKDYQMKESSIKPTKDPVGDITSKYYVKFYECLFDELSKRRGEYGSSSTAGYYYKSTLCLKMGSILPNLECKKIEQMFLYHELGEVL